MTPTSMSTNLSKLDFYGRKLKADQYNQKQRAGSLDFDFPNSQMNVNIN